MKIERSKNLKYKSDHVAINHLYTDGWMRIGPTGLTISLALYHNDDAPVIIGVDLL